MHIELLCILQQLPLIRIILVLEQCRRRRKKKLDFPRVFMYSTYQKRGICNSLKSTTVYLFDPFIFIF